MPTVVTLPAPTKSASRDGVALSLTQRQTLLHFIRTSTRGGVIVLTASGKDITHKVEIDTSSFAEEILEAIENECRLDRQGSVSGGVRDAVLALANIGDGA